MRPGLFVFHSPALPLPQKRQPRKRIGSIYFRGYMELFMKRTLTVILAVLMMLFAAGCYGNTTPDGTTRSRAHGGTTRGHAYGGTYDGLYRDGSRAGHVRDGAGIVDGAVRGGHTRAHGGTTRGRAHHGTHHRAHGGAMRGHTNRTHNNATDGSFADGTAGRDYQNYRNHRPMIGGLEYLR